MFDITYLGQRCFRFIKRHPRISTFVSLLFVFCLGIWAGRTVELSKITGYFRSYTDPEQSDVTKSVAQGIVHRPNIR